MNDNVIMAAKSIINGINDKYGDNYRHVVDGVLVGMGYIVCEEGTSYARNEIEKIINYLSALPGSIVPDDDFSYVDQKRDYIADKKPSPHAGARRSWAVHNAIVMQYMEYELKRMLNLRTVLELKKIAEIIEWENEG